MKESKSMIEQFLSKLTDYCQEEDNIYWQTTDSVVSSIRIDPEEKLRIFLLIGGMRDSYYSFNIMGLSLVWYEDEGVWRAFENTEGQLRFEV